MKIILLFPEVYTLNKTFSSAFEQLGHKVKSICYRDYFKHWRNRLIEKTGGLPNRFIKHWQKPYLKDINSNYIKTIIAEKPDLVIVYNDQLLLPETAKEIKKTCPLFNFLGDNPFFIERRPFNIATMLESDHVFSPDSFWYEQLKLIGVKNISLLYVGSDKSLNYSIKPNEKEYEKYKSDLLMIGRIYPDSWGYKRALFYSKFANMDIKIYGRGWENWFNYFPELEKKYLSLNKPLTFEMVNMLSNCSKIYPVDANPGLLNGIHIRIFDCIGSGILPLVEYRKDLDIVFKDVKIPIINNYNEAADKAKYFLENENERIEIIKSLQKFVYTNFTPIIAAEKIIEVYNNLKKGK